MIRIFQTAQEYSDYVPSQSQTDVSYIEAGREVRVHGVNVIAPRPLVGDVAFLDEGNNLVFVSGETLQKDTIPVAWTHVGYVFRVSGNRVGIIDKEATSIQFQTAMKWSINNAFSTSGSVQFSFGISSPSETRTVYAGSSGSASSVRASLTQAIAQDSVLKNLGLIVSNTNTGLTITQPTITRYVTGIACRYNNLNIQVNEVINYHTADNNTLIDIMIANWHRNIATFVANLQRAVPYLETNGRSNAEGGVHYMGYCVKKSIFEESEEMADTRAFYGTYENYVKSFIVLKEQCGVFFDYYANHDDAEYGEITISVSGSEKIVFPAIALASEVSYQNDLLAAGKWRLPTVRDIAYIMDDDNLAKLNAISEKMGTAVFDGNLSRWAVGKLYYNGSSGLLESYRNNPDANIAQAVVDIEI